METLKDAKPDNKLKRDVIQVDRISHADHGAQATNVTTTISDKTSKWVVIFGLVLIGLLLFTTYAATKAEIKANVATRESERMAADFRELSFWAQRVKMRLDEMGIDTPPLPKPSVRN